MIWKCIITALLCLPMSLAYAFTLNGNIANGRVTWDNLVPSHGESSLSTWSPISGLTPTEKWRPGFMASPQASPDITLTNGGNSVTFALSLTGIEYNTGSNSIANMTPSAPATGCTEQGVTGNVIYLIGEWHCSYDQLINNGALKTPFFFLRPLFNIDSSAVLAAFAGKPEGLYTGVMPMSTRYFYYTASGALTYRDLRQSFSVQIRLKPAYISSISLIGSGILVPTYDKVAKTVSATTTFDVNATGYFDKGIKMMLMPRSYRLTHPTSSKNIPYSIKCTGVACSSSSLVVAGTLNTANSILSAGTDKSRVDFKLDISYDNIAAANIESGRYTDSFLVLFETDF
ncbi:Uncharacterised protein [Aeromonas salmonicida]|uniref:hypothetical protein n=1 Tax=Aeromonas salmonicida TaxID=645 RepID=UPI001025CC81|nr:hypothetical protein [Aeromonas salmonicida]VFB08375.1 Uncharacterised protein [Aeromonas salmonicida]